MNKKILIRADASNIIGTGHVMRCLTLADEAKQRGWDICFVLRDPPVQFIELICLSGHEVRTLTSTNSRPNKNFNLLDHSDWLSVSQEEDAKETLAVVFEFKPYWVVVDHYALDAKWHEIIKQNCKKIMVIDDLGDRKLICDILLDQNIGVIAKKYYGNVLYDTKLLLGPKFALLRNEFSNWRDRRLKGKIQSEPRKLLITMGGVDASDFTLEILKRLLKSKYAKRCDFTVIIGELYPNKSKLNEFVATSNLRIDVLSNVTDIASIMSKSDLCIGAAGSTSWERCCLALPTITLAISKNQIEIAKSLRLHNLAIYSDLDHLRDDFEKFFDNSDENLMQRLSLNMRFICDGLGSSRVVENLEKLHES
jgi:UDP-2,4-diacetamido-2,4,6-trideoxy-beta-L-altropyranose hydrolase